MLVTCDCCPDGIEAELVNGLCFSCACKDVSMEGFPTIIEDTYEWWWMKSFVPEWFQYDRGGRL